jgi:gamma-glutamylputrescine oxidase
MSVPAAACLPNTWHHASAPRPFPVGPPLAGEARADVAIIGAGFTGVSAALDLAEAGLDVHVLEAHEIGAGASGRNGGLVCSGWRRDQAWFEDRLGRDAALKLWRLAEDAKADLRARVATLGIEAELRDGLVFAAHTPAAMAALDADSALLATRYGHDALQRLDRAATAHALGTDTHVGAWRDGAAGHVHPLKLLHGLAGAAKAAGAIFHEHTRGTGLSRVGSKTRVETPGGALLADHVLLCGDGHLEGLDAGVEARVMPISSFVLATEPLDEALGVLPGGEGAMDTRFVVNYWRRAADGRLIFGGGEKYTPAWPADIAAFVRRNLLKTYPQLAHVAITHAWGGALGVTPTRLPHVAQVRPNVWSASGYSGQGVALAPYFGRILARAVRGRLEGFDLAATLPVPAFPGGRLLRWPLLTAAMSYYALRDRLP